MYNLFLSIQVVMDLPVCKGSDLVQFIFIAKGTRSETTVQVMIHLQNHKYWVYCQLHVVKMMCI